MITEDYVSFETAKLLKEKGFNWDCQYCYIDEDDSDKEQLEIPTGYDAEIDAPTLQMAMKWLRKEHNLAISTSVTIDCWHSYVSQIKLDSEGFVVDIIDIMDKGNIPSCGTYEEVCEAAIKYCLENLI